MILNLSIGQGENSVTPLQLAHYTGIIATEGIDAEPHLIMKDIEPSPKRNLAQELDELKARVTDIEKHA